MKYREAPGADPAKVRWEPCPCPYPHDELAIWDQVDEVFADAGALGPSHEEPALALYPSRGRARRGDLRGLAARRRQ